MKTRSFIMVEADNSFKSEIAKISKKLGYKSTAEYVRVLLTAQLQIHCEKEKSNVK